MTEVDAKKQNRKTAVIGSSTAVSFGLLSSIIGSSILLGTYKEKISENSSKIVNNETKISRLRDSAEKDGRELSNKLSNIEGKLDIIIKRVEK